MQTWWLLTVQKTFKCQFHSSIGMFAMIWREKKKTISRRTLVEDISAHILWVQIPFPKSYDCLRIWVRTIFQSDRVINFRVLRTFFTDSVVASRVGSPHTRSSLQGMVALGQLFITTTNYMKIRCVLSFHELWFTRFSPLERESFALCMAVWLYQNRKVFHLILSRIWVNIMEPAHRS